MAEALTVTVHVLAGRNLEAKDSNGKSDPYCKAYVYDGKGKKMSKTKKKTATRKKTLNPDWSECEPFTYVVDPEDFSSVNVTVWDADFGKNDALGEISFYKEQFLELDEPAEEWVSIQPMSGSSTAEGELHVRLSVARGDASEAATPSKKAKKSRFGLGKLGSSKTKNKKESLVASSDDGATAPEEESKEASPDASAEASGDDSGEASAEESGDAKDVQDVTAKTEKAVEKGEALPDVLEQDEEVPVGVEEEKAMQAAALEEKDGSRVRVKVRVNPGKSEGVTVFLKLMEAQELPVDADDCASFAVLSLGDEVRQSNLEENTAFPVFSQNFVFENVTENELSITFWDKKTDKETNYVTETSLNIGDISAEESVTKWLPLAPGSDVPDFKAISVALNPNIAPVGTLESTNALLDNHSASAKSRRIDEPRTEPIATPKPKEAEREVKEAKKEVAKKVTPAAKAAPAVPLFQQPKIIFGVALLVILLALLLKYFLF